MNGNSIIRLQQGIAISLPVLYLLHLLEERYAGTGFPNWLNAHMGADLSVADFIAINIVAYCVVTLISVLFLLKRIPLTPVLVIVTVLTINGVIHISTGLWTASYSPGMITGALCYLPLGWVTWRKILPGLSARVTGYALLGGVLVHVLVILLALNV